MLKKRLIFSLLYSNGYFYLSRNFRLQKVGNIDWLMKSYKFKQISEVIDELFLIRVGNELHIDNQFIKIVETITSDFYGPFAIGGGIRDLETADKLFRLGADKITINEPLYTNSKLVEDLVSKYGSQAVVASIDYKIDTSSSIENNSPTTYYKGIIEKGKPIDLHTKHAQNLGCGELLIRSIDRDGTAFGLDLASIETLINDISVPLIISGGIGKARHIVEGLRLEGVDAVSTSNLLNFIDDGLLMAKRFLIENGSLVTKETTFLKEI